MTRYLSCNWRSLSQLLEPRSVLSYHQKKESKVGAGRTPARSVLYSFSTVFAALLHPNSSLEVYRRILSGTFCAKKSPTQLRGSFPARTISMHSLSVRCRWPCSSNRQIFRKPASCNQRGSSNGSRPASASSGGAHSTITDILGFSAKMCFMPFSTSKSTPSASIFTKCTGD